MAMLVWDSVGDRLHEVGLDRGVLYLEDGSGIPWNGLSFVIEDSPDSSNPVIFDGAKVIDLPSIRAFSGKISAITYPEELSEYEGSITDPAIFGLHFTHQGSKSFSMSYRTLIADDVDGTELGYKIHILYNLTAKPDTSPHESLDDGVTVAPFDWSVTSMPEEVSGFRPTAHVIADSRYLDPDKLEYLEFILYGTEDSEPTLLPLEILMQVVDEFRVIVITDHGDGTWSADGPADLITMLTSTTFEITGITSTSPDANTFTVTST